MSVALNEIKNQAEGGQFEKISCTEETKEETNLQLYEAQNYEQDKDYPLHERAYAQGGLALEDPGNLVPDALKALLKKAGKEFLKGKFSDAFKFAAPAKFHVPKTHLQMNAYGTCLCATHLMNASRAQTPLERLKWVIGYYVGGQHRGAALIGARIPFNPILGETLQLEGPNGEMFFGEQSEHHPPVSKFLLDGPGQCYRFQGSYESRIKLSGIDSISGSRVGLIKFSFPDNGTEITVKDPTMHMTSLLSANKVLKVSGTMTITDETNGLEAEFTYGVASQRNQKSKFGKLKTMMSSRLFGSRQQSSANSEEQGVDLNCAASTISERSDYFVLKIKNTETGEVVSEGDGSFLAYVQIDGHLYWQIGDEGMEWNQISQDHMPLLASDSSNRKDLQLLEAGNLEEAEIEKRRLEDQQRADKQLRAKAQAARKQTKKHF